VPPGYHEQHFIYECRRTAKAKDYGMMVDTITKRINWLRQNRRLAGEKILAQRHEIVDAVRAKLRRFDYLSEEAEKAEYGLREDCAMVFDEKMGQYTG